MRRVVLGIVLMSGLLASDVGATTVREMSLVDLHESSTAVVLGEVVEVVSFWVDGVIMTHTTITVLECFAGDCGDTVTVTTVGGQVGQIVQRVQGAAYYEPGEPVFAFLKSESDGRNVTVGMAQGVFHLEAVGDDIVAWANHSGMRLMDRNGDVHEGQERVTYRLADLIYSVRYDLPVLPMAPAELSQMARNEGPR